MPETHESTFIEKPFIDEPYHHRVQLAWRVLRLFQRAQAIGVSEAEWELAYAFAGKDDREPYFPRDLSLNWSRFPKPPEQSQEDEGVFLRVSSNVLTKFDDNEWVAGSTIRQRIAARDRDSLPSVLQRLVDEGTLEREVCGSGGNSGQQYRVVYHDES